ncbi:hypothetical protein CTAM01_02217 [Colletotrichum tamarilloi]|uniref:Uncharacterized protein n=1 Tax=Colletotrichum tamarilloi TaxID=1209934 RepID=A0ABQ9RN58_9PEZI|nr:uncharacterized protein CTAM01_02217 [Colletotrichum tamarilloi]KAK1508431.1 hypothetical protein CTAM01_02217 [Colletotrichum tamarilloi]
MSRGLSTFCSLSLFSLLTERRGSTSIHVRHARQKVPVNLKFSIPDALTVWYTMHYDATLRGQADFFRLARHAALLLRLGTQTTSSQSQAPHPSTVDRSFEKDKMRRVLRKVRERFGFIGLKFRKRDDGFALLGLGLLLLLPHF